MIQFCSIIEKEAISHSTKVYLSSVANCPPSSGIAKRRSNPDFFFFYIICNQCYSVRILPLCFCDISIHPLWSRHPSQTSSFIDMSTYSKNLFDILGDGEVPRPAPVKEEAAPVVVDKKNVSKINKDGKLTHFNLWFLRNKTKKRKSETRQTLLCNCPSNALKVKSVTPVNSNKFGTITTKYVQGQSQDLFGTCSYTSTVSFSTEICRDPPRFTEISSPMGVDRRKFIRWCLTLSLFFFAREIIQKIMIY